MKYRTLVAIALLAQIPFSTRGEEADLPLLVTEDFEAGADRWTPFDAAIWRIEKVENGQVFSQHSNTTEYQPPHRSPFLIALLDDTIVSDFDLRAKVKSTHTDYDHRDACIVFGFQNPTHFYYVHFGKRTDDHANQVFVVDDGPRTKISTKTSEGTPWTDEWHAVRIVRKVDEGRIEVYFDDLENPVMTASDKRFATGQIGIGSFDDTTQWDDIELRGVKIEKQSK